MDSSHKPIPERTRFYKKEGHKIEAPVWSDEADQVWQALLMNYFRGKPHMVAIAVQDGIGGRLVSLTGSAGSILDSVNLLAALIELSARGFAHAEGKQRTQQFIAGIQFRLNQVVGKLMKDKPWENTTDT